MIGGASAVPWGGSLWRAPAQGVERWRGEWDAEIRADAGSLASDAGDASGKGVHRRAHVLCAERGDRTEREHKRGATAKHDSHGPMNVGVVDGNFTAVRASEPVDDRQRSGLVSLQVAVPRGKVVG